MVTLHYISRRSTKHTDHVTLLPALPIIKLYLRNSIGDPISKAATVPPPVDTARLKEVSPVVMKQVKTHLKHYFYNTPITVHCAIFVTIFVKLRKRGRMAEVRSLKCL